MTSLERIRKLLNDRGWSINRLAKESGVLQSTLSNMFNRNNDPSISTLESICKAFGITMSDFFSDQEDRETLTLQQKQLLDSWEQLNEEQKRAILTILQDLKNK